MEFEAVGKPNVLISFSGVKGNNYMTASLNNTSIEDFVKTAENLSGGMNGDQTYKKIFDQIMKDKRENEYNRTQVANRYGMVNKDERDTFMHNRTFTPRIIETLDGKAH